MSSHWGNLDDEHWPAKKKIYDIMKRFYDAQDAPLIDKFIRGYIDTSLDLKEFSQNLFEPHRYVLKTFYDCMDNVALEHPNFPIISYMRNTYGKGKNNEREELKRMYGEMEMQIKTMLDEWMSYYEKNYPEQVCDFILAYLGPNFDLGRYMEKIGGTFVHVIKDMNEFINEVLWKYPDFNMNDYLTVTYYRTKGWVNTVMRSLNENENQYYGENEDADSWGKMKLYDKIRAYEDKYPGLFEHLLRAYRQRNFNLCQYMRKVRAPYKHVVECMYQFLAQLNIRK